MRNGKTLVKTKKIIINGNVWSIDNEKSLFRILLKDLKCECLPEMFVVSFMDDKWSSKLTINNITGWIDEQASKKNAILLIF